MSNDNDMDNFFAMLRVEDDDEEEEEEDEWCGKTVRIEGLVKRPELNGLEGFVESVVDGRLRLRCGNARPLAVKPENAIEVKQQKKTDLLDDGGESRDAATWFLLELEKVCEAISKTWKKYRDNEMSLLAATSCTNFCVGHAHRLATALELEFPELASLESVVAATYLAEAVDAVAKETTRDVALRCVVDVAFGADDSSWTNFEGDLNREHRERIFRIVALHDAVVGGMESDMFMMLAMASVEKHVGDATGARRIVTLITDCAMQRFLKDANNPDHFFIGGSGILWTSELLRRLNACEKLIFKGMLSVSKRGFHGAPWDEATKPATRIVDLDDYLRNMAPTCAWYAAMERDYLHIPELVPLWTHLRLHYERNERRHGEVTTLGIGLVVVFQAAMLSVVHVNSTDRGCGRVMTTVKLFFSQLERETKQNLQDVVALQFGDEPNINVVCTNLSEHHGWLETVLRRYNDDFSWYPNFAEDARRARDMSLLLNPYVAGQFSLVAFIGNLLTSLSVLDSVAETRLILHCYNALQTVDAIEKNDLLEFLATILAGGTGEKTTTSNALWFTGHRPKANFHKAWFESMGMSVERTR